MRGVRCSRFGVSVVALVATAVVATAHGAAPVDGDRLDRAVVVAAAGGVSVHGRTTTFAQAGAEAVATLLRVFYTGNGTWNVCDDGSCGTSNQDWGVDSLTYALYLRWATARDAAVVAPLQALIATAPVYGAPCGSRPCAWSDMPEWDAVAAEREYEVTGDPQALVRAREDFAYVEDAAVFARGACPRIRYQQPEGEDNRLK